MKKNLLITIVFLMFFLSGCGIIQFVPKATQTDIPTQMALPTYTPMPTYTPYPTPTYISIPTQEPTSVPNNDTNIYEGIPAPDGVNPTTCPNVGLPMGASNAECYLLNDKGLGVIYFDNYGDIWGVGASFFEEDNLAYMSGQFLAWGGMTNGMNGDDIVGALQSIKEPETWYTYNTVKVTISIGDGKVAFVIKPSD